jgi:hypothetical protein
MPRERDAQLETGDNPGAWTCVVLNDVAELFGTRGLVKIRGAIEGEPFTGALMAQGDGTHRLPVKAALRKAIGKQAGETVHVRIDEPNRLAARRIRCAANAGAQSQPRRPLLAAQWSSLMQSGEVRVVAQVRMSPLRRPRPALLHSCGDGGVRRRAPSLLLLVGTDSRRSQCRSRPVEWERLTATARPMDPTAEQPTARWDRGSRLWLGRVSGEV